MLDKLSRQYTTRNMYNAKIFHSLTKKCIQIIYGISNLKKEEQVKRRYIMNSTLDKSLRQQYNNKYVTEKSPPLFREKHKNWS